MLTIHKASAGSGKTFRLARNYIRLILGYQVPETNSWRLYPKAVDGHRHILGVTFTNKATAEMKKRIIEELSLLADINTPKKKNKHLQYMCELFSSTHEEVAASARRALVTLLTNFRDFNVSTIDSFFQTVLRTFAHELDLPDNFNLQLDDSLVVEEAVDDLLNTVNGDSALLNGQIKPKELSYIKRWLLRYMEHALSEGKNFNIFKKEGNLRKGLIAFITSLMDERFKANAPRIMAWCSNTEKIEKFEQELNIRVAQITNPLQQIAIDFETHLNEFNSLQPTDVVKKRCGLETILECLKKRWPLPAPGKTTLSILEGDGSAIFKKAFVDRNPGHPIFQETVDFYTEIFRLNEELNLYKLLRSNLYPLGLFGEVMKRIEAYRKQKNTFLLSDTNGFLQQIISDSDTPFIYERLGSKLRHFLLDEFQDTSILQWENLRPLLVDSLSTDYDNLIIGDEKQCIYRFRNSDPELINHVVSDSLAERFDNIEVKGQLLEDNTNWRSDSLIVKFNNSLFPPLATSLNVADYYGNVIQKPASESRGENGYVDILFLNKSSKGNDEDEEEGDEQTALQRCSDHILRQLYSGYRPSDICVLVRTGAQAEKVIKHLLEVFETVDIEPKPEVVSGEALKVSESPGVRYVISRLRLLLLPQKADDNSSYDKFEQRRRTRALFARFHLNNISSDDLENGGQALADAIEGKIDEFGGHNNKAINLSSVVESLIADYINKAQSDRRALISGNENVYLYTLLDKTVEFEKNYGNNMVRFLDWWDSRGCATTVKLPENVNAVTVSTIHKSKGLEYPCVHVPFVDFELYSSINKANSLHWFDMSKVEESLKSFAPPFMPLYLKRVGNSAAFNDEFNEIKEQQRLDALNLLYVAFTRPINELIATASKIDPNQELDKTTGRISKFVLQSIIETEDIGTLTAEGDPEKDAKRRYVLPLADYFDGDSATFVLGSPTAPTRKDSEKSQVVYTMPPFATSAPVIEITRPLNLHKTDWNDPRQRGDFLHNTLSRVRRWADLDFALRQAAYRQSLTPSQQVEARQLLDEAYDHLEQKHWFRSFKTVVNETSVYNFEPRTTDRRRPDRLMIFPDGSIEIVDYKFATPDDEHIEQVKRYVDYMRSSGREKVKGYLWYPLRRQVVEVFG